MKVATILALASTATFSSAAFFTAEATNNATVQPAGPRSGSNGKTFFNVEGSANNNYASFGVADFSVSSFGVGFVVGDVSSLEIKLTQSNASFTKPGSVRIYLATDTATSIESTNTSLKFDTNSLPGGVGSQLGTLYDLGVGVFSGNGNTGSGSVDLYSLALSGAAKTFFISQLNTSGATLRLVITPETDTTAATWAGYSHSTYAGPTLNFEAQAVPEPATIVGLALAAGVILARRRRS